MTCHLRVCLNNVVVRAWIFHLQLDSAEQSQLMECLSDAMHRTLDAIETRILLPPRL